MRLFVMLITFLGFLCTHVQADKDSIGYEMIFFYYVYKMGWSATKGPTMPVPGCSESGRTSPCGFSSFVRGVMATDFVNAYNPLPDDDTQHPTAANLVRFEAVDPSAPRQYDISHILTGSLETWTKNGFTRIPNAQVVRRVWGLARKARDTMGATGAIMDASKAARDAARECLQLRFENSKADFTKALKTFLTDVSISFLISDEDGWYNWKASLDNVDKAADDGRVSVEDKIEIKKNIKDFSEQVRAPNHSPESMVTHLAILQEYQEGITQISKWINQIDADEFEDTVTCSSGITKRDITESMKKAFDSGKPIMRRFLGGLQQDGLLAYRTVLAPRGISEL